MTKWLVTIELRPGRNGFAHRELVPVLVEAVTHTDAGVIAAATIRREHPAWVAGSKHMRIDSAMYLTGQDTDPTTKELQGLKNICGEYNVAKDTIDFDGENEDGEMVHASLTREALAMAKAASMSVDATGKWPYQQSATAKGIEALKEEWFKDKDNPTGPEDTLPNPNEWSELKKAKEWNW